MSFLSLLFALVLRRFSSLGRLVQHDAWFHRWMRQVARLGLSPVPSALAAVTVPCVIAQALLCELQALLFGLFWMVAAIVMLLYALGRTGHGREQEQYRSFCRRGDFEAALLALGARPGWVDQEREVTPASINDGVQRGFLYQGYEQWFAVLFYFFVAGPVGALAYRLVQLCCTRDMRASALLFYVDWLPARLLAATFALAGNLVASLDDVWRAWHDGTLPAADVLHGVAVAATESPLEVAENGEISGQAAAAQNEMLSALMRRAGVCWLAIVSLLVILL